MNYLLFDIGGTRARFAVSRDGESFSEPVFIPTPQDFEEAVEKFSQIALEISGGDIFRAAGGIAGSLNLEKTGLFNAPNLPSWSGRNFTKAFGGRIKADIYLENDTAMVGLGETVAGAGKLYHIVAYITISTGVNGVRITGKKIDENTYGFEIGRQIIDVVNNKNLEDFVSGREIEKRYARDPQEIKDTNIWVEVAKLASVGIYNSILHWSPEVVVLGGSMMNDIPIVGIENSLKDLLKDVYPEMPKVVKAELGSIGGIHGALHYIKSL